MGKRKMQWKQDYSGLEERLGIHSPFALRMLTPKPLTRDSEERSRAQGLGLSVYNKPIC